MRACVVIGVGQLGRLFGAAALACGYRTTPILKGASVAAALADGASRGPILITVGERALPDVLAEIPRARADDVILVQNELFPALWRSALGGEAQPTVAVVWSSVKKGRPIDVGRATHVHGPYAQFVRELHGALDAKAPCVELRTPMDLETELVAKYAFILTVNMLGLEKARTVGEWLDADPARVDEVLSRTVALGEKRVGHLCPGATAIARGAMSALRSMPAAGRTAQERIDRAREVATRLGVSL